MQKNKIAIFILIALSLLPLNIVFGSWSETDQTGIWGNAYDYYWETPDNGTWHSASLDYSYGWVENFTEWKATITQYCHGYGWCVLDDDFEVKTVLKIVDNASTHEVEFVFYARHDVFWGRESVENTFALYVDGDHKWGSAVGATRHYYFDVYQNASTPDEIYVCTRYYDENWVVTGGWDYHFNFGADWFKNVTLTQTHEAWGKGWCLGTKQDETIVLNGTATGTSVELPTFQETLWKQLWDQIHGAISILPQPLQDWLKWLNDTLGTIWVILTMIWGMVVAFLPVVGIFYFLSFIGVFFTGIVTGNMNLIQTYVMKQYELANDFFGTVVSAIHAIWALIKFW